jgi:hypothetical protein
MEHWNDGILEYCVNQQTESFVNQHSKHEFL